MGKRVVLDTNILLSAVGWKGNPYRVLQKVVGGELELVISFKQFDELTKTLNYPRLKFSYDQKLRIRQTIKKAAIFVKPRIHLNVIKRDPADNMILEAAVVGKADYIVTGDKDLLDLGEFTGIKIMTASKFLSEL